MKRCAFAAYVSLTLLVIATKNSHAQRLDFGLIGGVPLTDVVGGSFGGSSEARRYTIGLMLELTLPRSFAFESNVLYKRVGYRASQSDSGISITGQVRAHSWEFPLLLKYHLPFAPAARPFIGGGYVLRNLTAVKGSGRISGALSSGNPIDTTFSVPASAIVRKDPTHGVAVATGLRIGIRRLHLTPQVRYTRWGGRPFDDQGPRGFSVQSSQNQLEMLVGLSF